ncbi:MAG: type II CAAX endopeptidase family protein [Phycisphaerales bacterium]|jgi:membrane protease YdiL (CAAX protease family)|nr:type II CAAX endopeptidase family protein [Phycisphaerales bacterium]
MMTCVAKGTAAGEIVQDTPTLWTIWPLASLVAAPLLVVWFIRAGCGSLQPLRTVDSAIRGIVLFVAVLVAGGIGAAVGGMFGDGLWAAAGMLWGMFLFQSPVLLLLRGKGGRAIWPTAAIGLIVFGIAAFAVASVAHALFVRLGWEASTAFGHELLGELSASPHGGAYILIVLAVTIGAGTVEELTYRGLLQPAILSIMGVASRWPGIIVTSGLFAFMHAGPALPSAMCGLFVFSLGLGWARERSGGLWSPILMHIAFNAINIAMVYSTPA